jgi:hypothetical protein
MATVSIQYSDGSTVSWEVADERAHRVDRVLVAALGQPDAIFARAKNIGRHVEREGI